MAKRNLQKEAKFQRILNNNRYRTSTNARPSRFYALVDVRIETKNLDGSKGAQEKTYVIEGTSRWDAQANAEAFLQENAIRKGRITGVYPVR